MSKILNLIIGGATGTIARYVLSGVTYRIFGTDFPYGTLVVNLTGCFIIGFLTALSDTKFLIDANSRILLMIGFCGAYTTFSTLILETDNLIKNGQAIAAFTNVLASVIIGLILFRLGALVGELI